MVQVRSESLERFLRHAMLYHAQQAERALSFSSMNAAWVWLFWSEGQAARSNPGW
jgi:hypothetical protein